jgi:hypothetical protein
LEKPDFALYASFWCPDVTWDKLKIMAFFITWSFIWNDEIDVSEGSYHFDFAEAQAYREESLKAIQNALGLGEQPDAQGTAGQNTFLRSFEILGKPLCEEYTIGRLCIPSHSAIFTMTDHAQHNGKGSCANGFDSWTLRSGNNADASRELSLAWTSIWPVGWALTELTSCWH